MIDDSVQCLFRIVYVPRDAYDLLRKDAVAFQYFYTQVNRFPPVIFTLTCFSNISFYFSSCYDFPYQILHTYTVVIAQEKSKIVTCNMKRNR